MANVVCIYLAAGKSKRMGQNKLALLWRGSPLGSYGLQAACTSEVCRVFVVLNTSWDNQWLSPWVGHPKVCSVICPEAATGQAASLCTGIAEAVKIQAEGAIIQLADQPFVDTTLIDGLIKRFLIAKKERQAFDYIGYSVNGMVRPPILFNQSMFLHLLKLEGDKGAQYLLKDAQGIQLGCQDVAPFMDIDTPKDFYKLMVKQ